MNDSTTSDNSASNQAIDGERLSDVARATVADVPTHRSFYTFTFTGKASEFFRIWIVNVVLSVLTLGIYSAWAKVRTKQYFYGNTILDGSAFAYTAKPINILKGRAIAVAFFIAYATVGNFSATIASFMFLTGVALLPAIIVLSLSFRMRYTAWRGINFGFKRDFTRAYLLFLPPILYVATTVFLPLILGVGDEMAQVQTGGEQPGEAPPLSEGLKIYLQLLGGLVVLAGLLFPWWQKMFYSFVANRSYFGNSAFSFIALTIEFYGIYLSAILVFIGGMVLVGVIVGILSVVLGEAALGFMALLILIPYAMTASLIQTQRTNIIFSNLELNEISFSSELKVPHMMYLYITNTLAILLTLGLAIPWAKIRIARYRAETMRLFAADFAAYSANNFSQQSALGDGATDVFDIDIGF